LLFSFLRLPPFLFSSAFPDVRVHETIRVPGCHATPNPGPFFNLSPPRATVANVLAISAWQTRPRSGPPVACQSRKPLFSFKNVPTPDSFLQGYPFGDPLSASKQPTQSASKVPVRFFVTTSCEKPLPSWSRTSLFLDTNHRKKKSLHCHRLSVLTPPKTFSPPPFLFSIYGAAFTIDE